MRTFWRDTIGLTLIAIVILVFTFPDIDPTFGPGVDWSLAWAYNYIFATDINLGRDIIFPHGPLGFLMYPVALGDNLDVAFWAICIIRVVFFYTVLRLGSLINPAQWLLHTLIVLVLAQIFPFGILLSGIVAASLLVLHFLPEGSLLIRKWVWILVAVFFTALGLHIRAAFGIISVSFLFSYLLIDFYQTRNYKTPLYTGILFILSLVLFRFFIYGNLDGFFNYYFGLFQLSKESSAATALYPDNNWKLLGTSVLLFFLFPFIVRKKNVWFVYALFLLPTFASWKHGITREDLFHIRGLFIFLILFFSIILIVLKEYKKRHFLLIGILLICFYLNIRNATNYFEVNTTLFNVNRFSEWLNNREDIKKRALEQSLKNIEGKHLPDDMKAAIGNNTVDVYPWDFSFIPANNLNWQPRIIPQNYAAYSPWLDEQNAKHFTSAKAPDFIIWEFLENQWGGFITGLDGRYAFNDEPQTILKIIDNYSFAGNTKNVMLLKKAGEHYLGESKIIQKEEAEWNNWIAVPDAQDGILRAKFDMSGTLWRKAKNFFYKDEEYSVEYKLENGQELKFRFVPEIAVNGVWVNPLIMHPEDNAVEPLVREIRFTCSNYKAVKGKINIEWELTEVKGSAQVSASVKNKYANAFTLFGKKSEALDTALIHVFNDYEKDSTDLIEKGNAYSGNNSFLLKPEGFAPGLELIVDSSLTDSVTLVSIAANAWMNTEKDSKINLVVTVESEGKTSFWEAVSSDYFISETNRWQPVFIKRKVTVKKGDKIKVYAWNISKGSTHIDDMDVKIFKE